MTCKDALNDRTRTCLQTKSPSTYGIKRTTQPGYYNEITLFGTSLRAISGELDNGFNQVNID